MSANTRTSWLARLPVGLFAIPVGLFALAGTWRRASGFEWDFALPVADVIASAGLTLLLALSLLYVAKAALHRAVLVTEISHPFVSCLMALIPMSWMLCSAYFAPSHSDVWMVLTLIALAMQAAIALRMVSHLVTGSKDAVQITPAIYLPPVAGSFVAALAFSKLGYPGWAGLTFGMGIAAWALLEARVMHVLFDGPLPEPVRATIGIELAPPAVGTLVAGTIWSSLPGEVLIVGLGFTCAPAIAIWVRWKWWSSLPFSIGFWSFSFPVAAFAGGIIEVVHRGHWPEGVAAVALGLASAAIAFLLIRTLILLFTGKLIPPTTVLHAAPILPANLK